jgi:molecular chaperone GrpE
MTEKKTTKTKELEGKLIKALADYQNLQRDSEKRVSLMGERVKVDLARALMPVMDDITFAIDSSTKLELNEEAKAWLEGVKGTFADIKKVLDILGVSEMRIENGTEYNSEMHEAVGVVNEGEKDRIHQILQPGYILGETVVRPARVIVSKGE